MTASQKVWQLLYVIWHPTGATFPILIYLFLYYLFSKHSQIYIVVDNDPSLQCVILTSTVVISGHPQVTNLIATNFRNLHRLTLITSGFHKYLSEFSFFPSLVSGDHYTEVLGTAVLVMQFSPNAFQLLISVHLVYATILCELTGRGRMDANTLGAVCTVLNPMELIRTESHWNAG